MATLGLIGGTLAGGSGLLMLMTWLETSLQKSLTRAEAQHPTPASTSTDAGVRGQLTSIVS